MDTVVPEKKETATILTSVVEHWAKSRIDSPLQVIARYDDAAKQIITVTGIIWGILIAAAKITDRPLTPFSLLAAASLLSAIVLAAWVVILPTRYMGAHEIYRDLRSARTDRVMEDTVDRRIERWCEDVASVATRKLQRLTWAMCLLAVGLAMSIACLLESMGFDK
jgi:hypothetical protein